MQAKFYVLDFISKSMIQDLKLVPEFVEKHGDGRNLYKVVFLHREMEIPPEFTGNADRDVLFIDSMMDYITKDNKESNRELDDVYIVHSGRWPYLGYVIQAIELYCRNNSISDRMTELLSKIWIPVIDPSSMDRGRDGKTWLRAKSFVMV